MSGKTMLHILLEMQNEINGRTVQFLSPGIEEEFDAVKAGMLRKGFEPTEHRMILTKGPNLKATIIRESDMVTIDKLME